MIKFKEIPLLPSNWTLDVIVSAKDDPHFRQFIHKRYGIPIVDLERDKNLNTCNTIDSGSDSILQGETRIVVILRSLKNKEIVVHELIHALWHAARCIGYEMTVDTQEWQAVMYEYMYVQTLSSKGWIPVKKAKCKKNR